VLTFKPRYCPVLILPLLPNRTPTITDRKILGIGFRLLNGRPSPELLSPVESLYGAVAKSNTLGAATARAAYLSAPR